MFGYLTLHRAERDKQRAGTTTLSGIWNDLELFNGRIGNHAVLIKLIAIKEGFRESGETHTVGISHPGITRKTNKQTNQCLPSEISTNMFSVMLQNWVWNCIQIQQLAILFIIRGTKPWVCIFWLVQKLNENVVTLACLCFLYSKFGYCY